MSYISDQEGILRRYNREKEGWSRHLEITGRFISNALDTTEISQLVVLGSGWLLDFPLEKISKSVQKITLVDVHFPSQVLRKVQGIKAVECISADITGGYIEAVFNQVNNHNGNFIIPEIISPPRIEPEKGKLIISLNILNQLDILLIDYIRDHADINEDTVRKFRNILQESHIRMLQEHSYILITDFREILINTHGKVLEEKELIFTDLPSGDVNSEWDWLFDTHRLYNSHADTLLKVKAVFSKAPQKL